MGDDSLIHDPIDDVYVPERDRGNGNLRIPSSDEAREMGKKGGIASGKARREKRDRKLRAQATLDLLVNDPETLETLQKAGINIDGISFEDAIDARQALKAAREGDTQAYKALKEEAYGKLDNKTELELSGEVSGININIKKYDKE